MSLQNKPVIEELGRFHRLGALGPAYEVIGPSRELEGDWLMDIVILESGERLEYRASHIRVDPPADSVAASGVRQ